MIKLNGKNTNKRRIINNNELKEEINIIKSYFDGKKHSDLINQVKGGNQYKELLKYKVISTNQMSTFGIIKQAIRKK